MMDHSHTTLHFYIKLISKIFSILLLHSPTTFSQNLSTLDIPDVSIVNVRGSEIAINGNITLNLQLEADPTGTKHILQLTKLVQTISIDCTSFQPVQWSFTGFSAPLQVNLSSYRKQENNTEIFIAELFIFRVSSQLTGEWSCNLVQNNTIRNSVFIFAEEHSYRGEDPFFLEYGKERTIYAALGEKEVVFPCLSFKRNIHAKLAKKVRQGETEIYEELDQSVLPYSYDPTIGFTIQLTSANPFGKYLCYTLLNKTFDRVTIFFRRKINVEIFPNQREVEIFEGEALNVSCRTEDPTLNVEMVYPTRDHRIALFKPPSPDGVDAVQLTLPNVSYHDEGSVSCNTIDTLNGKIVHKHVWDYHVISTHDKKRRGWKYYFSKRLKEHTWVCWAKTSNVPSVSYVQCTSPMECEIRSACFKLGTQCDAVGAARLCSGGCILLGYSKGTPGRLTCQADGLTNAEVAIYIGVSGQIYNKTQDLEKDALFASHDQGRETFAGTVIDLQCMGSSFKFSRGFYWRVQLSSGEFFRLDNNTKSAQGVATLKDYFENFNPKRGIITLLSKVKVLTVHIVSIICIAPHWDSFDVSDFALNLSVKEPRAPKFTDDEEDIDLNLGDTEQRITCKATGIPNPKITWMKDGKSLPNSVLIENDGDTLLLEEVTFAHHGTYSCQAANAGGSVLRTFTISVTDSKKDTILWVAIPGLIFIVLLCIVLALFWRRIQRQKAMLRNLTDAEIEEFLYGNPDAINRSEDTNKQGHLLAYNREYEFPKDYLDIQLDEKLGSGAYGLVLRGIAKGLFPGEEETVVAIKTLQPNADITHFKSLLIELKIMSSIGRHPRLVNLLGACTTDIRKREVYIIVEFCENGSLEKFLKNHRCDFPNFHPNVRYSAEPQRSTVFYENQPGVRNMRIEVETLIKWCFEISDGMDYLSSKKVIHGDLAARNILLTDGLFAKIGDFGLSRQLYEYTNYVKKQQAPLPWRWMAIESLCDMEFSHKSDVWAIGITFWEIFSLGEIPYPGTNWTEEFVRKLRQGNRPPKPDLANDFVYNMMIECWRYVPADRPTFAELRNFFSSLLEQRGVLITEPPHAPVRHKFNMEISNQNYGIQRDKIIIDGES